MVRCRYHSIRCEHYSDGRCGKNDETWLDRVIEYKDRKPGDGIRLRIPEDLDALIEHWVSFGGIVDALMRKK
jgi:hypothetical protein